MEKIGNGNKTLFGEYAVLISGFDKDEQIALLDIIESHSSELKAVFATMNDAESILKELFRQKDGYGFSKELHPKKAIVMSGFEEKELVVFMKKIKSLNLGDNLWAVLTPISNNWKLNALLEELEEESKAIKEAKKQSK
jgi:hypothetical protein